MAQKFFILTGDKKLNRRLEALGKSEAKKIVRKAATPAMVPVRAAVKRNAKLLRAVRKRGGQRGEGPLFKSIRVRSIGRSRKQQGRRIMIGDVDYAGPVEWGYRVGRSMGGRRDRKRSAKTGLLRTKVEGRFFMKAGGR